MNQYLVDDSNQFCARIKHLDNDFVYLLDLGQERLMHQKVWGVTPKNIHQGMAMEALMDPNIDMVILTSTLLAVEKLCLRWLQV